MKDFLIETCFKNKKIDFKLRLLDNKKNLMGVILFLKIDLVNNQPEATLLHIYITRKYRKAWLTSYRYAKKIYEESIKGMLKIKKPICFTFANHKTSAKALRLWRFKHVENSLYVVDFKNHFHHQEDFKYKLDLKEYRHAIIK